MHTDNTTYTLRISLNLLFAAALGDCPIVICEFHFLKNDYNYIRKHTVNE